MSDAWVTGIARSPFGKFPDSTTLSLQAEVSLAAMRDAELSPVDVDGVITGYSTVSPHLMPANVLSERIGARPSVAFGMNVGGATGLAMVVQAARLVTAGAARRILVVAGENRATGQSRQNSTGALAQVAHPEYELPMGVTVPTLYAMLASRYFHRYGLEPGSLAPVSVQMRANASRTEGAHYRQPLTVNDVVRSPTVASPLHRLECSPVSDGAVAVVVEAGGRKMASANVRVLGSGGANRAQHLTQMEWNTTGAAESADQACEEAGVRLRDVGVFGIYDSFTVTLALLLEEMCLVPQGETGQLAAAGEFGPEGGLPLNLHGGLLSYGHSGVAGGLAHFVEVVQRLRNSDAVAGSITPSLGFVHGDGGVMSAHVSMVLERKD